MADQSQQQSKPNSSDLPATTSYSSSLSGMLPTSKRRRSPFDRLGAASWEKTGKGQMPTSYAGK
jgi:hypothetical protein